MRQTKRAPAVLWKVAPIGSKEVGETTGSSVCDDMLKDLLEVNQQ